MYMTSGYELTVIRRDKAQATAEALLKNVTAQPDTLLSIDYTEQQLLETLQQVDHIFTDADGTIVADGHEEFTADKIELFAKIAGCGVGITIITGKPLAEAVPLRQTLPSSIPISFICEKGAYNVHFDKQGAWREFLLSSAEQEESVAELRRDFLQFQNELIKQHGSAKLGIGWGGSGEHKSALSIDLFAGPPPKDYLQRRGAARDAIKLKDEQLIEQIEQSIDDWVEQKRPGWRVVHVGNANTEISPGSIGKREAIIESAEFGAARKVLLLGDSPLDKSMFTLHGAFSGKALTGLVLHRKSGLSLIDMADLVTFGMANSNPILQAVINTHRL